MSYLSYMTNHYQHAINDQANATKATKYIQHYGYKKPFLKSENTENERYHKNTRKYFVHWDIQFLRHIALTMISL